MVEMQIVPAESEGAIDAASLNGMDESYLCETVKEDFKPFVGQEFVSVDEAAGFYKIYALSIGFDIRRYSEHKWDDGTLKTKLIVCNREGKYKSKKNTECVDNSGGNVQRRGKVLAVGCKARIRLFCLNGRFKVDQFVEEHNHELVSVEEREFQKLSTSLTEYHKAFILSNIRLNIGATKTYRMIKEHVNGFENIGATLNQFRNFQRDMKCFIHERDGQLLIDRFKSMEENIPDFFFDYDVDEDGSLRRVIWADGVGRRNYQLFGEAISFDPTYSTNKYSMVFTPFTGVDNHKKTITFCGALIAKEDFESFNWVFTKFMSCMGGKEPEYIITDQDPGIIKSVSHMFKHCRHRFCTWHIMSKVSIKYGATRNGCKDLLAKLNSIIWDEEIEPADFDSRWVQIMEEYGVGKGDWFEDSFSIRRQWVQSQCKDLRMGSLLRTTQRSESSNSFFKKFEHKTGTLIEFWMRFESAIEQQRHNKKRLDNGDKHSTEKLITHLKIEEDASKVYTTEVFEDFQKEVKYSVSTCRCKGYSERNDVEVTLVEDSVRERVFEVEFHPGTLSVKCSCRLYERKGILCRHVLWIYTSHGVEKIPDAFVARRWMRSSDCNGGRSKSSLEGGDNADGRQVQLTKLWAEINETVAFLQHRDLKFTEEMCESLRKFREDHKSSYVVVTKEQEFEKLLGCQASSNISVMPPKHSKNKGSGKRMVSSRSIAIATSNKRKRLCNNCKQMANHDKRNCPYPFVESAAAVDSSGEDKGEGVDELSLL